MEGTQIQYITLAGFTIQRLLKFSQFIDVKVRKKTDILAAGFRCNSIEFIHINRVTNTYGIS